MPSKLDAGAEAWLFKYAYKNYWKVKHVYDDIQDLIQDGYWCWSVVANKYDLDITKDGRMMNLFKITFTNHIRWVSTWNKNRDYEQALFRLRDLVHPELQHLPDSALAERFEASYRDSLGPNDTEVAMAIIDAAEPIRSVLRFLTSDRGSTLMRRSYRRRKDGSRETPNDRLSRYVGCDPSINLLEETRRYLTSNLEG